MVIAFPTGFLVVDLHVERQRELARGKDRVEVIGEGAKDVLAGLFAGREIAPLAEPQHHVEKAVIRAPVGDGVVLATDGANTNATGRENAGLHRRLADHFDNLAHIETGTEIGGVFDREMRHVGITPTILRDDQAKEQADRAGGP